MIVSDGNESIARLPDIQNPSAIAHSKGLSMAFMLYFQPKFF